MASQSICLQSQLDRSLKIFFFKSYINVDIKHISIYSIYSHCCMQSEHWHRYMIGIWFKVVLDCWLFNKHSSFSEWYNLISNEGRFSEQLDWSWMSFVFSEQSYRRNKSKRGMSLKQIWFEWVIYICDIVSLCNTCWSWSML